MNDFVPVVSQSPPVGMTSTKPAAKAAVAPGQDPFELVLQMTSERILKREPKDVSKGSEKIKNETNERDKSSAKRTVNETQEQKEVNNRKDEANIKKTEQNEEKEKQVDDKSSVTAIQSENVAVEQKNNVQKMSELENGENIDETELSATPSPELKTTSASTMSGSISADNSIDQSSLVNKDKAFTLDAKSEKSTLSNMENHTNLNEMESSVKPLSLSDSSIVDDKTSSTTPKQNANQLGDDPNLESLAGLAKNGSVGEKLNQKVDGNSKLSTENNKGEVAQTEVKVNDLNSENSKEKVPTFVVEKEGKIATDKNNDTPRNNAPPDISPVTVGGNLNSTVKTSQTNEPARLAEAPRNEVITQVASQLDQMVKTNRSTLRMQLYPEELGHIELKIVTTKSGIGVTMIADSASTQEILRSEMNSLKQNMQQAGIQLSDLNIGQGQNSNKQQMFDEQQGGLPKSTNQTTEKAGVTNNLNKNQAVLRSSMVDYRI